MNQKSPINKGCFISLVSRSSLCYRHAIGYKLIFNVCPSAGVFENVLGFKANLSVQLVEKTKVLGWILNRIQLKTHDENRGYAAEILSILLQDNRANRLELGKKDGVETILKVLSVRNPSCAPYSLPDSRM